MTDEELHSSLRRLHHAALADRLVDAVQYSSTNRSLRKSLSPGGAQAWRRVMADVGRAFGRPPFLEWLANLIGRKT